MKPFKLIALLLIVAGILALAYGGFSYTKKTHSADLGPIEFKVKDKERVVIPTWAGAGAIVAGGALLFFAGKKK